MTSELSLRSEGESGRFPLAPLALALLAIASPTYAEDAASLALFHGPDDIGSMDLKTLRMILDGSDLQVAAPSASSDSSRAIYEGMVAPGVHKLEVEAVLEPGSLLFSYMDGYRIKLRSVLDLEVLAREGVAVRSRVLPTGDLTAPWQERHRLVLMLSATGGVAERPAEVAAAPAPEAAPATLRRIAPEPAPEPSPVPGAPPTAARGIASTSTTAAGSSGGAGEPAPRTRSAPSSPAAGHGDCSLQPIRFAFDRATLTPEARESLDGFVACLPAASVRLRVEGHCDTRGSDLYNQWLGWDRAAAVTAYLRERGVPARQVRTHYLGKSRPVCTEATSSCHALNRRVEVLRIEQRGAPAPTRARR